MNADESDNIKVTSESDETQSEPAKKYIDYVGQSGFVIREEILPGENVAGATARARKKDKELSEGKSST